MIEYRPDKRLYILAPGLEVAQTLRPAPPAGGWWDVAGETCVAAYQAKGAASQAASYVNLTGDDTYDITAPSAPTWDTSTGWSFNGTGNRLMTGVTVETNQVWTMIVRFDNQRASSATSNVVAGCLRASGYYFFIDVFHPSGRNYGNGNQKFKVGGDSVSGAAVMAVAGRTGYHNGSAEATIDAGTGGTVSTPIAIGCRFDNSTTPTSYFLGTVQAVAIYSTTLDATQIANLTTAMNAL